LFLCACEPAMYRPHSWLSCEAPHPPPPARLHVTLIDWPNLCTLPPRWAMCWARLTSRPQLSSPVGCWRTDWFVRAAISNRASAHSLPLVLLLRSLNQHFQLVRLFHGSRSFCLTVDFFLLFPVSFRVARMPRWTLRTSPLCCSRTLPLAPWASRR
jgi:hypothetical protein